MAERPTGRSALRLPLLVSILLLAVVLAFGSTAYRELENSLEATAGERMRSVASLFADLFEQAALQIGAESNRLAAHPAAIAVLRQPNAAARGAAIEALRPPAATFEVAAVQIWDLAYHCLVRVGGLGVGGVDSAGTTVCPSQADSARLPSLVGGAGELQSVGDTVFYHATVPVKDPTSGLPLGYVGQIRRLRITPPGLITRLIGDDARLLVGNRGGALWTDLSRRLPGPAIDTSTSAALRYRHPTGETRLGWAEAVDQAPWLVWVDFSEATVLEPARRLRVRMMIAGAIITLVGIGVGVFVSRR